MTAWLAAPRVDEKPLSPRIVRFELAWTGARADEIKDLWGNEGQKAARVHLLYDFAFLVAYSLTLAFLCGWAGAVARGWGLARLAVPLAWSQLAAGALDAVENVALLRLLKGTGGDAAARLAGVCAATKFLLAGLGVIFILVAGGVYLFGTHHPAPRTR